jgi:hypothetical protein
VLLGERPRGGYWLGHKDDNSMGKRAEGRSRGGAARRAGGDEKRARGACN